MTLYAYCLSDEGAERAVEGAAGVGGASVRVVRFGGGAVAAVVSDYEGERVAVARENVLAHNAVNGRVLAETTPLPFRFGTLVGEERLAQYVAANEQTILERLARVSGCVEMSVKVIWDAPQQAARREAERGGTDAEASGTAYLLRKRREIEGGESLKEQAEEVAAWLARALGDAARESRVEVRPSESLVVRASFLVGRARLSDYEERLRAARAERARALRFLTSGPWPPYSFSEISP